MSGSKGAKKAADAKAKKLEEEKKNQIIRTQEGDGARINENEGGKEYNNYSSSGLSLHTTDIGMSQQEILNVINSESRGGGGGGVSDFSAADPQSSLGLDGTEKK